MIVFIIFVVFSTVLNIQSALGFFLFFFFRVRLLDLLLGYTLLQVWLPRYLNFFVFQLLVSSNVSLSTLLLISNIHLLELFNTILSSILTSCWNFIWDKAWQSLSLRGWINSIHFVRFKADLLNSVHLKCIIVYLDFSLLWLLRLLRNLKRSVILRNMPFYRAFP